MFEDFISILPELFSLFIPGYFCLIIFNRLKYSTSEESLDHIIFYSVIVSYVLSLITGIVFEILELDTTETIQSMVTIALGVILGFVFSKIIHSKFIESFFEETTNISMRDNIWEKVFDPSNDTLIRVSTNYRGEEVLVEGKLKFHDVKNDFCDIVIVDYKITYDDGEVLSCENNPDCMHEYLYLNSQNVNFIEISNVERKEEIIKREYIFSHYKK